MSVIEELELTVNQRQEIVAANRLHTMLFGAIAPSRNEPLATAADSAKLIHAVEALYDDHDPSARLEVGLSRPRDLLRDTVVLSLEPYVTVDRTSAEKRTLFSGPYRGRVEVIDQLEVHDPENLSPTMIDRRIRAGWLFRHDRAADSRTATASQVESTVSFLELVKLDEDRHVRELPNVISSLDQFRLQSLGQRSLQLNPR